MGEPAFIDANILVYAFGGQHRLKGPCQEILREISRGRAPCWSSAEVLQELLHIGLRRGKSGRSTEVIRSLVALLGNQVVPVDAGHITWCLSQEFGPGLQSRDRVHVAVMNRLGVRHIVSSDRGYDSVPGITRLDPAAFSEWRGLVFGG